MSGQTAAPSLGRALLASTFPQLMTLCLGFFSLANAFALVGISWVRFIAAVATGLVVLVMFVRIVMNPTLFCTELTELAGLAAYQTGFMATYFLAGVLFTAGFTIGIWLWWGALCLNLLQIVLFVRHLWQHRLGWQAMTPMWYLLGMGIGAAAISGMLMGYRALSVFLTWYTIIGVAVCTPAILRNFFQGKPQGQTMQPIKAILCAAPSLTATLMYTVWPDISLWMTLPFFIMGQCFLVWIYVHLPQFIHGPFMITFSSLTFPLGISASACILTVQAAATTVSAWLPFLRLVCWVELFVATLIILYVILRFVLAQHERYVKAVATAKKQ